MLTDKSSNRAIITVYARLPKQGKQIPNRYMGCGRVGRTRV